MGYIERLSKKVATIIIREGLDYYQTKAVFRAARQQAGLTPPKPRRRSVERLTIEQQLRFIDRAYQHGGRTGLMMQVLLETGARVSEFVQIRIEDVSLAERLVIIRSGKGGKRREVPIRRELARLLEVHIDKRRVGPLFRSRQRGSGSTPYVYTRQRIGQLVNEVAVAAEIQQRVYPHLLRHTVATKLLELGMDIASVKRFLGHEDISTTQLYAEASGEALRKKFDQVTDRRGRALIASIQEQRGDTAAAFASEILSRQDA